MNQKDNLNNFADMLINQKRLIRSIQYLLITSFTVLIIGIISSLPLRYYFGISFEIPLIFMLLIMLLSFIYGFLGIENRIDVLREADERKGLNEKLSAAYQYGDSDNPYSKLIINESRSIINALKVNEIFHVKYSRRDPFQPLLLALLLFLWLSSFTFLEISESNIALGQMLADTSEKIDAANSEAQDKDIEDIADEYNKLGQKIQDQFMNDQSIEKEVDQLSKKLERKIDELSREGVKKDSQTLGDDEDGELYQLKRKTEMSDELSDILQSLMKTFSISPNEASGGMKRSEGGSSGEGDQDTAMAPDGTEPEGQNDERESDQTGESTPIDGTSELEVGEEGEAQKNLNEGTSNSTESDEDQVLEKEESSGSEPNPSPSKNSEEEEEMFANKTPGAENSEDTDEFTPLKEEKQSGEFDEENIRGELKDGEQMKSFIRALPHIVEPSLEDMEIIYFYRNQLETAIDREILPEAYESVVRDYFLSIGVLNE